MMLFFVERDFQYLAALCLTMFFGKLFTSGPHFMMIENMFDIRLCGLPSVSSLSYITRPFLFLSVDDL